MFRGSTSVLTATYRTSPVAPPTMLALSVILALMIAVVAHDTADHR